MECLNRITLIGYVTKVPTLTQSAKGTLLAQFELKTIDVFYDKNNNEERGKRERYELHNIVAYSGLANLCSSLEIGHKIYVSGKQEHYRYTDRNGVTTNTPRVVVENIVKFTEDVNRNT